ncbi:hypothetical protein PflCFBP13517_25550 [Pseudomonas fluorescens]|nr:hypothetical protein PflCFBP13517_25550 [Pseudomonas fluorescens]
MMRLVSNFASSTALTFSGVQLGFPGAAANPLPAVSPQDLFKTSVASYGFEILSRGFGSVNDSERQFFTGTVDNSIVVVNSAIDVLERTGDELVEEKLKQLKLGAEVSSRLLGNYEKIKEVLLWMKEDGLDDIYIVKPFDTSNKIEAINLVLDDKQRIAISQRFFKKCTVPAMNTLLHEVAHLCCNKIDFYYLSRERSCLDSRQEEKPLLTQLSDFSLGYMRSIGEIPNSMGGDEYSDFLSNGTDGASVLDLYKNNAETRDLVDYMNADTVAALAIVLADFNYRQGASLPLCETSKYKVRLDDGDYYLES